MTLRGGSFRHCPCCYPSCLTPINADSFGILIAYLLPGFVCLWGFFPFLGPAQVWLTSGSAENAPTIGGFLYGTLASMAAGLIVSALRWMVVDKVYHRTGIREPRWDFQKLSENLAAFEGLVANHYRYYQCYSNLMLSIALLYTIRFPTIPHGTARGIWLDLAFVLTEVILFFGSRDTLRKYYRRSEAVLGIREGRGERKRKTAA